MADETRRVAPSREERRAAALRENLRKRKEQARARASAGAEPDVAGDGQDEEDQPELP